MAGESPSTPIGAFATKEQQDEVIRRVRDARTPEEHAAQEAKNRLRIASHIEKVLEVHEAPSVALTLITPDARTVIEALRAPVTSSIEERAEQAAREWFGFTLPDDELDRGIVLMIHRLAALIARHFTSEPTRTAPSEPDTERERQPTIAEQVGGVTVNELLRIQGRTPSPEGRKP